MTTGTRVHTTTCVQIGCCFYAIGMHLAGFVQLYDFHPNSLVGASAVTVSNFDLNISNGSVMMSTCEGARTPGHWVTVVCGCTNFCKVGAT